MRVGRIVCYLLVALGGVQLILLYFENRSLQETMPTLKETKVHRILGGYSRDSSGRYYVHRFYKSEGFGLNDIHSNDVTLVTHCTVDRLHHIIGLTETWAGPMSISIFAPGSDAAFADDVIDGLRLCWPVLRKWASFHLVYPKGEATRANMTGVGGFAYYSCKDITRKMMLRKLKDNDLYQKQGGVKNDDTLRYPHNLMRNVALSGVLTDFVLAVDIEMIPSRNLRRNFIDFAAREKLFAKIKSDGSEENKTIFVIPSFETRNDVDVIRTKRDLLQAVKKTDARPLLQELCVQCHKQTNYDGWTSLSDVDRIFGVAYEAKFAPGWEPYFIARRVASWYDENMTNYGHDRLSQICELRAKKYSFQVLNNGFLLRKTFRYRSGMTSAEISRKDDKAKFHERFRVRLRESGKIASEDVRAC